MTCSNRKPYLAVTASIFVAACGSSGGNVPDGRQPIDAPSVTVDAAPPADALFHGTITVNVTVGGQPAIGAVVLIDDTTPPQTQATTDDSGQAVVTVDGTTMITAVVDNVNSAFLMTMTGVAPGESISLDAPDPAPTSIDLTVTGESPDDQSNITLFAPNNNQGTSAANTTPTNIMVPATTTTTPAQLLAVSNDGLQYVGTDSAVFTADESINLPTHWVPLATLTYETTGLPDIVNNVEYTIDSLSGGYDLHDTTVKDITPTANTASATASFPPVGDVFRFGTQVKTSNSLGQTIFHHATTAPTSMNITLADFGPWLSAFNLVQAPFSITWGLTPSGGSAQLDGTLFVMGYGATGGAVQWIISAAPDATSFTAPVLPTSVSKWSPVGASNFNGFPLPVSSDQFASYNELRTSAFKHLQDFVNNDTAWLGNAAIGIAVN